MLVQRYKAWCWSTTASLMCKWFATILLLIVLDSQLLSSLKLASWFAKVSKINSCDSLYSQRKEKYFPHPPPETFWSLKISCCIFKLQDSASSLLARAWLWRSHSLISIGNNNMSMTSHIAQWYRPGPVSASIWGHDISQRKLRSVPAQEDNHRQFIIELTYTTTRPAHRWNLA